MSNDDYSNSYAMKYVERARAANIKITEARGEQVQENLRMLPQRLSAAREIERQHELARERGRDAFQQEHERE